MNNLVSIITPAYNASQYIKGTIESVLNQTYDNWELIIVNDGSTDNTKEIVESFKDSRIKLINQKNMGVSVARNRGLSEAQGEFITFLDADDILPPKSLEVRVKYLKENSDVDLVDGYAIVMDGDLKNIIREHKPTYKGLLFEKIVKLDSSVYLTCYYMFRHKKLGDVKFRAGMTHAEDLLFFIELAYYNNIIYGSIDEKVFIYRFGHNSAMKNIEGIQQGYIQLLKELKKLNIPKSKLLYLRFKIAKIMFLVWLKRKQLLKSLNSLYLIFLEA